MCNGILGRFEARTIDGKHYVVLEDSNKITTISIHADLLDAQIIAHRLNTVYDQ